MSGRFLPVVLGVLTVVVVASPAAAQSRREMQMMADIRMLQEQTQQLQQQLQTALQALTDSLKGVNTRLDDQAATTKKSLADQKLAVDQFGADLRVVRERVDDTNVRISSLSQEVEALRLSIPNFPSSGGAPAVDPNAAAPSPTAPGASTAPPTPANPTPPPTPAMSPQRLFDTAWADFTGGQWALCIEGFNSYLLYYSRTDNADDAQFYIGECYYSDGKFPQAVDAYSRLVTNYPKGDRVPDAYYKRGLAYDRLGQADKARESFDAVMKLFPDSDAARMAKQNLDRLGRKPGQ